MDSGLGIELADEGVCSAAGLLGFKAKIHEIAWRAATSSKYHFPESRVQLLLEVHAGLGKSLGKAEQAHEQARKSGECPVDSRPESGLSGDAICSTARLLAGKIDLYETAWEATISSKDIIPENRVRLLFEIDTELRKTLFKVERGYEQASKSEKCPDG